MPIIISGVGTAGTTRFWGAHIAYSPGGRLSEISPLTGGNGALGEYRERRRYSARGQLEEIRNGNDTITYQYDQSGRISTMTARQGGISLETRVKHDHFGREFRRIFSANDKKYDRFIHDTIATESWRGVSRRATRVKGSAPKSSGMTAVRVFQSMRAMDPPIRRTAKTDR